MTTGITLKVVSFNVGGSPDLQRTAEKFKDLVNKKIAKVAEPVFETAKRIQDSPDAADKNYKALMEKYIAGLLSKENPDILCLQEMPKEANLNKYEHAPIGEVLKANGYELQLSGDAAIAYKTDKFESIHAGNTNNLDGSASFADLKIKENGSIVRVVSDHVAFGGNGTSLSTNLDAIDLKPLTFFQKIRSLFSRTVSSDGVTPNLIIYGLDANGTRTIRGEQGKTPEKSREWNSDRVQYFNNEGYRTDNKDTNPTYKHFDENEGKHFAEQKIDHIYVKEISCFVESIKSIVTPDLNDKSMLVTPKILPASDHLPVIYEIKVANESWTSLIKRILGFH